MHPGHQYSSQLFCTYIKHLSEDLRRSQHAYLLNVCHSSCCWYFLYVFFHPLLHCTKRTNNHRDHSGFQRTHSLYFLVLGLCTCFSFPFSSERCFYQMEQSYQSVCRWNSPSLQLRFLVRSLLEFSQYWLACPIWWWCFCLSIVHHSLWLKLVPFVCNLDIMIFTNASMGDMLQHYCALRCTLF